jgi:glutamine synthetase
LALALCLAAGLEGIEQKLDAAPYCSASGGNKTLDRLPQNLGEAIQEFEQDALIQKVLGEELSSKILEAKKAEWKEYSFAVTDWELDRYLARY